MYSKGDLGVPVMGIGYRKCKHTKERLKQDRKEGVRLPRGGGFVSVNVVRERERRDNEESESERREAARVRRNVIGTRGSFSSCVTA